MIQSSVTDANKDRDEHLRPTILSIDSGVYEAYIDEMSCLARLKPDISQITGELVERVPKTVADRFFSGLLSQIRAELSNPEVGIAVVDMPESPAYNSTDNAFWGVVLSLALGSNIFPLGRDRINNTPFTVYAASYQKSQGLIDLGLRPVAPETKLGFHTDGVLHGNSVSMPINIMLYNIDIEYRQPGNFYWIPFSIWGERDLHMQRIGVNRPYRIKITPSVYEAENNQLEIVSPQQVTVPIVVPAGTFGITLYLNGDVTAVGDDSQFDQSLIEDLRRSLAANPRRFVVPQKARRLIFVRNVFGAHARDIFEEPNLDALYTRIFLRSVDENCIALTNKNAANKLDHVK